LSPAPFRGDDPQARSRGGRHVLRPERPRGGGRTGAAL